MKPNSGRARSDEMHFGSHPGTAADAFWNKSESLARLGGDEELLRELCGIFLEECPKQLQKLRQGIEVADPEAVMRAAHGLKGELGYLGAEVAAQASRALEDMGHEKDLTRVREMFDLLERELGNVCLGIQDFLGVAR